MICASPLISPTQQLWIRQWGLRWPAWGLRWFYRLCLWKSMALSKYDSGWLLYRLQEGQTACSPPGGYPLLWVNSPRAMWGSAREAEQSLTCSSAQQRADILLGMLPSGLLPPPHWAFPASSQRDSGFPTELAAARHPGPRSGNSTWFLHYLLPAPGYYPEGQRYGVDHSPGAQLGGAEKGSCLVQHPSPRTLGSLPLSNRWPASAGESQRGCPSPLPVAGRHWPPLPLRK